MILSGGSLLCLAVIALAAVFLQHDWPARLGLIGASISFVQLAGAALNKGVREGWLATVSGHIAAPLLRRPRAAKVIVIVMAGLLCAGGPLADGEPDAVGDVTLARQGTPTLLYTPPGGGLDVCSHAPADWSARWFGIAANASWKNIASFAAVGSTYSGIEVLARRGDQLYFGYRSPDLHWHTLRAVDVPGRVRGRPALVEWGAGRQDALSFIGFAPDAVRGVRVDVREDYRTLYPFRWFATDLLAPQLGRVDAVAAVVTDDAEVLVVIRRGPALFEVRGRPTVRADGVRIRWGDVQPILHEADATGDPTVLVTDSIGQGQLVMAVPTGDEAAFLTGRTDGTWDRESIPLGGAVDALTMIDAETSDGRVYLMVVRRERNLYTTYKATDGKWQKLTRLRCHHAERPARLDE